ncbi:rRNA bioproteinsis protein rrp36 [Steccherinum ochraceum]|uniref:rRNA biogenesis protein RRP36 n=1 Tax=Steccherinum ochraceum TaxID=92696 RepID=A0A4R0S1F2_9APHY|nr:rRNA bioproteinsis protein rrp36 [Steccherinum ochraceum]
MPRRPRPASRRPPQSAQQTVTTRAAPTQQRNNDTQPVASSSKVQLKPIKSSKGKHVQSSDEEDEGQGDVTESAESGDEDVEEDEEEEEQDLDADAPRIAQWVDEEELELDSLGDDEEDEDVLDEDDEKPVDMGALQDGLSSVPFGTLRKAQNVLSRAEREEDGSESDESSSGSEPDEQPSSYAKHPGKEREKHAIEHRKNKHAPMEVTSKRPVPRKKVEIEEARPIPRDPRFLPLAGEFSAQRFQSQYSFLTNIHQDELKTLRENLRRAKKLLTTSPRDVREEREAEVERLERAMKRAESTVNKDRRDRIEGEAREKVAKEEKERRKSGKGAWYMKKADEKEMLVRAKYEALEAAGGRGAVKKAIEKKQKKINQKEKKSRPFGVGQGGGRGGRGGGRGGSRSGGESRDSGWPKRQREPISEDRPTSKRQRFT